MSVVGAKLADSFQSKNLDELMKSGLYGQTDFRMLTPWQTPYRYRQVNTPGLFYSEGFFGGYVEQIGRAPRGYRTFALLAEDSPRVVYYGGHISQTDLIVIPNSQYFNTVSPPGFHGYMFTLPEHFLADIADKMFGVNWLEIGEKIDAGYFYTLTDESLKSLRDLLQQLSVQSDILACLALGMDTTEPAEISSIRITLGQEVIKALLTSNENTNRPLPPCRDRSLRMALDFIERQTPEFLSTRDLAEVIGASVRTLEYAFQQHFSMSPKKYLRARQLNFVMRDLRKKSYKEASVTDISNHWGLTHPGQFAKDYRALFGELPSQTLRKDAST